MCLHISVSHQATDISFKQALFCFIYAALMGSYLVFSAYLFLPCRLRLMCLPNLIVADPDFHLHVGGLLNPIPGKPFVLHFMLDPVFEDSSSVCSPAFRRRSLPLTWMLNAQMYLDRHSVGCTVKGFAHTTHKRISFILLSSCLCPNLLRSLGFCLYLLKLHMSPVFLSDSFVSFLCCFFPPCPALNPFSCLNMSFSHLPRLSADCQFEIGGSDGIIRSSQVDEEEKVKAGDALDCIWTIRAPPQSKVSTAEHAVVHP